VKVLGREKCPYTTQELKRLGAVHEQLPNNMDTMKIYLYDGPSLVDPCFILLYIRQGGCDGEVHGVDKSCLAPCTKAKESPSRLCGKAITNMRYQQASLAENTFHSN
jgi:hypothetical protein